MRDGFKTFVGSYNYDGAAWGFTLQAKDAADAKARLARMAAFGSIDGELAMTLPAYTGPLAAIVATVRNLCRRVSA